MHMYRIFGYVCPDTYKDRSLCIYINIYREINIYICIYICIGIHIHTYAYTYEFMYVYTYVIWIQELMPCNKTFLLCNQPR